MARQCREPLAVSGERAGHRLVDTAGPSQASRDTWAPGWGEAWAVTGDHEWAAVAAVEPIWGETPAYVETPADGFKHVARTYVGSSAYVQL